MSRIDEALERLGSARTWDYHPGASSASEPTALAAAALLAHDRADRAIPMLAWLLAAQSADGSVGITAAQSSPGWPTGWAVLAWQLAGNTRQSRDADRDTYSEPIGRAVAWILGVRGAIIEQTKEFGHDSTIAGWPWVVGTHSWVEPTAIQLLALKAVGNGNHVRGREAVRLLIDRLLSDGGCNYGNTVVFGQELRPQVEPTGLAIAALAGEADSTGQIQKSLDYLEQNLSSDTTTASLCYGLLGLAAHDVWPRHADAWLDAAARRTLAKEPGAYHLALLALASLGRECPILPSRTEATVP